MTGQLLTSRGLAVHLGLSQQRINQLIHLGVLIPAQTVYGKQRVLAYLFDVEVARRQLDQRRSAIGRH